MPCSSSQPPAPHSAGLKPRDVALARSLNNDRLSQLYIKADESTLDASLTHGFTARGLPDNAARMLFMTRGCGVEANTGLLIVPKLDYLQLLVVEKVCKCKIIFHSVLSRAMRTALALVETLTLPCADFSL